MSVLLGAIVAAMAVVALRLAFLRASASGSVDHWYWLLAARAYREQSGFPVRIPGKYLLEDETQAYPPGFGLLLARFPESVLRGRNAILIVQAADLAICALLCWAAIVLGYGASGALIVLVVYGAAPVLVAYNTQLTSRGLGTLFLVVKCLAEVGAVAIDGPAGLMLWLLAACAAGAVILTHKMTTQFMIALWPFWPLALGEGAWIWPAALVPLAGLAVAALVTGPRFQLYQWRAHADIVAFWHRNRSLLGAHAFRHSPLYGDPARAGEATFHKPGVPGIAAHLRLVLGYAPLFALLPVTLLLVEAPPAWIWTWLVGAYALALLTLFVPALQCFGGGHLYVFVAAPAGALWWAHALGTGDAAVGGLFAIGAAATAAALYEGWRRRRARTPDAPEGLERAIEALRTLPAGPVAVFPLVAAERVAFETGHSVLWGGHGYGFRRVEPIFPVVRERVRGFVDRHGAAVLLIDSAWWPGADGLIAQEFAEARVETFGSWRLAVLDRAGEV